MEISNRFGIKSLGKRVVFGPVVHTPNGVKPVTHKRVFMWKNEWDDEKIMRCKGVVAQGF